jgi:iron(III) transport system permease protein
MNRRQSAALDRTKFFSDPVLVITVVLLILFLVLFVLYPLVILLVDSLVQDGKFTLSIFDRVLNLSRFKGAFWNTIRAGVLTSTFSTIIGLVFAYVDVYVKLRSRILEKLFNIVALLPVVSPPFVLSLSMICLFGKAGLVTRSLLGIYDSNIYGLWGLVTVQTMTFFPVCYMMLRGLLRNIDPSLEEAARDMGASRLRVFATVTFPLILPGLGNAFLITFIESAADFANAMLIGGNYDTLATTIYLQITGAYDKSGAAAMAVVLLSLTIILFIIQKYYIESKTAATLTGKASRARVPITEGKITIPLTIICSLISIFVITMYIMVLFGALFKLWGRDYSLVLDHFKFIFSYGGLRAFKDSALLSGIASPITAILSMIIAYLVVKKRFRAKGMIELLSMLALAVPGTVLGVGFIRGFSNGLFHSGFMQGIYGSSIILIIVFIVRSLPTGTRSGISALRQIDKSIEESAIDLGASSPRVFFTVTLPLIKDSFLSGLVTAFVRSITAISAVILLVTPRWNMVTVQINSLAEKGTYGPACAYATILIVIVYAAVALMDLFIRHFGTSKYIEG